jgi:hypothetical protein
MRLAMLLKFATATHKQKGATEAAPFCFTNDCYTSV